MSSETACYLYCVCPSRHEFRVPAAGIADAPVLAHQKEDLVAIWSEVVLDEFCGEAAEERMKDLAWVAPRAAQHESVIEEILRQGPVLPTRFATLFRSIETLEAHLAQRHDCIALFFARLGRKREWAVKGLLDQRAVRRVDGAEIAAGDSPGARYLHHKRSESVTSTNRAQRLREICRSAALELQHAAEGFQERRIPPYLSPETGIRLIFNWAFLLSPDNEAKFGACVNRLDSEHARDGLSLRLSGPWPPYSFAPAYMEYEE